MLLFGQEAAGGAAQAPNMLSALLPFVLIFVIFYFIIIMPARKKQKQHQNLLNALQRNERVVTNSGIYGTITRVMDDRFELEISSGVTIQIAKNAIAAVITPQGSEKPAEK